MPTLLLNLQERLPGAKLDEFLTGGWRPVGQQIYTCDFIRTEWDELFGCIQLRLPLEDFKFKRKQRRLLRRNAELFTYRVQPAIGVSREMREVNRRYMQVNPDKSRSDLEFHVGYYPEKRFIDTHQIEVYRGDELVAFSYFDVGKRCVYSKTGIYDPALKDFSLGNYTMLLEIQWAIDNGIAYYHPGYFSSDYPVFNYKLRLGTMQYRDCQTGAWQELPNNDPEGPADPLHLHQAAQYRLSYALGREGVKTRIKEYPSFTARFYYPGHGGGLVDAPYVCQLQGGIPEGRVTLVTWDHTTEEYTVFNPGLSSLTDIKLQPVSQHGVTRYPRPVPVEIIHTVTASLEEVRDFIARIVEHIDE